MTEILSQADEFRKALEESAPRYGVELGARALTQLRLYYEQVMAWNGRLHLVAPCSPREFATRHVLESLVALPHLARDARVADIGSGAGLPIIPCLIARPRIRATLIESSAKKSVFLREALRLLDEPRAAAATVIVGRFETMPTPEVDFITCRALDRFTQMLPALLSWSPPACTLLLFGGPAIELELERGALRYRAIPMPDSEQRFLFVTRAAPSTT
ncbi:MAG TPA: 16S rRNA (guanine(527)-N(7))-methyltransferase RsmG [Pyrinomonadaceae bacterium]|jgi:16S rRNA (guanine527-N7)-methyltransferase|nr:16S rRNA (guanine(527)-N(7))-methyltransferase RsmG [Pyrinomonadaceae bacterium]